MGVVVTGDKELLRKLDKLDKRIQRKSIKKANGKAARPIVRSAKALVRPVSKTVAKGIGVKNKMYAKTRTGVVVIGVRNMESVRAERPHINPLTGAWSYRTHDPRHTAHLIEGGTSAHTIPIFGGKATVRHPGTKAKPFLSKALEQNESTAVATYRQVLRDEVLAAVK